MNEENKQMKEDSSDSEFAENSAKKEAIVVETSKNVVVGSTFAISGDSHIGDNITNIIPSSPPQPDPTHPHPSKPKDVQLLSNFNYIKSWCNQLLTHRVLIIGCSHEDPLNSIEYTLATQTEFKDYGKRILYFRTENNNKLGIERLIELPINNGNKGLVFIHLDSVTFLDSLFYQDNISVTSLQERAKEKHLCLVCIVSQDEFLTQIEQKIHNLVGLYWRPSPLEILLSQYFDNEKALNYSKGLMRQMEAGVWGNFNSEHEIYKEIKTILVDGETTFISEYKIHEQFSDKPKSVIKEFLESKQIGIVKAESVLERGDSITIYLTFIAAYFSGISIREFCWLAEKVLEGKTWEETEKIEIKGKDDTIEITEKKNIRNCLDFWKKERDNSMDKAWLISAKQKGDSEAIDFKEPHLREDFIAFFEQKRAFFLHDQFTFLFEEQQLLFDRSTPPRIVDNLARLFARIASKDPGYYGMERVLNLMITIQESEKRLLPFISDDGHSGKKIEFIEGVEIDTVRRSRFFRLSGAFLQYPNLLPEFDRFLNYLIDKRQYSFMFGILLDLRYNTSFSKFHWVRQLLERGIKPACDEAINFLINLFLQGTPLRVQEYYRELSAWLPETGRTYERYSEANKYCFAVMVLFYENSFDKQTYQVGEWPPSYQVFALLDNSENSIADFWIPKLNWLFHAALPKALSEVSGIEFSPERIEADVAQILESWHLILHGLENQPHPDANKAIGNMVQAILQIADKHRVRRLLQSIGQTANYQLTLASHFSTTDRILSQRWRKRRDVTCKFRSALVAALQAKAAIS